MKVTIDPYAGFCFGVERAIRIAEENMFGDPPLGSLGELVHNEQENKRLAGKGLSPIKHESFINLKNGRVLFRAHGEPPTSYMVACKNNTKVLDATCPVVKKLQSRIAKAADEVGKKDGAVLIFGRKDHPEVIGLLGHAGGNTLLVQSVKEAGDMDLPAVVRLFSQTTKGSDDFLHVQDAVVKRMEKLHGQSNIDFRSFNTICGQVSGREKNIREFAAAQEVLIFVGGRESSNGKMLFRLASEANPRSHYISDVAEIRPEWFSGAKSAGITGATSTPHWLMEEVLKELEKY